MPHKSPLYHAALLTLFTTLAPPLTLPAPAAIVTWTTDNSALWNTPSNWPSSPNLWTEIHNAPTAFTSALSPVTWISTVGGSWFDTTKWSSNPLLPGPNNDVTITKVDAGGDYNVALSSNTHITVHSLTVSGNAGLNVYGGTLTISTTLQTPTSFPATTFKNATLQGATITGSGGFGVDSSDTLDGVTFDSVPANYLWTGSFSVQNNLTLSNSSLSFTAGTIHINDSSSILGTGSMQFSGGGGPQSFDGPSTLTIAPGISMTSLGRLVFNTGSLINQGLLSGGAGGTIGIASPFINSGTVTGVLTISSTLTNTGILQSSFLTLSGTWSNPTGMIIINAGSAFLGGYFSSSELDPARISRAGGTLSVGGVVSNTGRTLSISPALGAFNFLGTLLSGTLSGMGGATLNNATFDGVTVASDLIISNPTLFIKNDLTLLSGHLNINGNGVLNFLTPSNLAGTGTLTLSDNANVTAATSTLTIAPSVSLIGSAGSPVVNSASLINQGLISAQNPSTVLALNSASLANNGLLEAKNGGQLNVSHLQSNSGIISANNGIVNVSGTWSESGTLTAAGGTLNLGDSWSSSGLISANGGILNLSGSWTNTGTLSLTSGTLNLGGAFTTADLNLPAFSRDEGILTITGSLDNTNALLPLPEPTDTFILVGTLKGGTLTTTDDDFLFSQSGTLDGLTLAGRVSTVDSSLAIAHDLTFAGGTLTFTAGFTSSTLSLTGSQNFLGNGTLHFAGTGGLISGPGSLSIHAPVALVTAAPLSITLTMTNEGLLSVEPGAALLLSGPSFTSTGTLQATSAPITFASSTTTLAGTIQATNGATLNFTAGTVIVTSPITLSNAFATFAAPTQSIATISGPGTVTLSASHSLAANGIVTTSLILGDSSTLTLRSPLGNPAVSKVAQFTFNPFSSTLNINTTKFIVQATSINKPGLIATLSSDILAGLSTTWLGPGITSSQAANDPTHYEVQLFDNAILGLTALNGQPVDQNSLILSLSHIGDANNNGIVDIQDQSLITNNWQHPASTPTRGDLNHDGFVDIQDLTLITNNWQQQSAFSLGPTVPQLLGSSPFPSPVPEPTTLLLLTPTLLLLSKRPSRSKLRHLRPHALTGSRT